MSKTNAQSYSCPEIKSIRSQAIKFIYREGVSNEIAT